jgi:hypothetical protein
MATNGESDSLYIVSRPAAYQNQHAVTLAACHFRIECREKNVSASGQCLCPVLTEDGLTSQC